MPSKIDNDLDVSADPPIINPYKILSVPLDATEDQIKKAYRKASLKHHPDKATGDLAATATQDFQNVVFAYAILSDSRRRRNYDNTGSTSETVGLDDNFDWTSYYRERYADLVTLEAMTNHKTKYKGGEQERQDVIKACEQVKGNMTKIYEVVMHSDMLEDDERFRRIIDEAIENGELLRYKRYADETEEKRAQRLEKARVRAEREAKEAEEHAKELGLAKSGAGKKKSGSKSNGKQGEEDLLALIQQKHANRRSAFLEELEAKYVNKDQPRGKKRAHRVNDEPPEEAFAAMADRSKKAKKK